MNTPSAPPSPAALLREADARMAQALDNFFQRSRSSIQDIAFRALATQATASDIETGQTCLDWLDAYPEALSTAFADQFRSHLARPETFTRHRAGHPSELQLVDDHTLKRRLAEEMAAAYMTEILRAEMLLLFGRLEAVQRAALEDPDQNHADLYGPLPVVRALSRALDALRIDPTCGTVLIQCVRAPLLETLKHTYTALSQFLGTADIPDLPAQHAARRPPPGRSGAGADAGQDVLSHIRAVATRGGENGPADGASPTGLFQAAAPRSLSDSLADWHPFPPGIPAAHAEAPTRVLRQLQQDSRLAGAAAFDLAVLDAVAGLFDFILDDPGVSPHYRAEIAQLQIPVLRIALVSPDFFSDDQHPARRLIDLVGLFSRRFPEGDSTDAAALGQIRAAFPAILHDVDHPAEACAQAHDALAAWLAGENARAQAGLAPQVTRLEHIERQEMGMQLALENLSDLAERYPAPESVLRRLEAAWVPHMASLYVAESGEGPDWRAACLTLQSLFLSLQPPANEAARETRLQSIPAINTALRHGLLAQGAEPAQLKDFFSAITATQERWIRPETGQRDAAVNTAAPRRVSQAHIEARARQLPDAQEGDPALQTARQVLEGDWVDFDPPYDGHATARVAWVGARGHLLLCDSEARQGFPLDCERLASEIRAGRARVPEQSLTRKAMLRLKILLAAGSR